MFCGNLIKTLFILITFVSVIKTVKNKKWILLVKNNNNNSNNNNVINDQKLSTNYTRYKKLFTYNPWKPLYGKTIISNNDSATNLTTNNKNLSKPDIINKAPKVSDNQNEIIIEEPHKPATIIISENLKNHNNSIEKHFSHNFHNSKFIVDNSFSSFLNYFLYDTDELTTASTTTISSANTTSAYTNKNPVDESRSKKSKGKGKYKVKKKYKKFLLPLLIAYKLKFFTLIPVFIGGLVLLAGSTGLAGFFFALFAAIMGLKNTQH